MSSRGVVCEDAQRWQSITRQSQTIVANASGALSSVDGAHDEASSPSLGTDEALLVMLEQIYQLGLSRKAFKVLGFPILCILRLTTPQSTSRVARDVGNDDDMMEPPEPEMVDASNGLSDEEILTHVSDPDIGKVALYTHLRWSRNRNCPETAPFGFGDGQSQESQQLDEPLRCDSDDEQGHFFVSSGMETPEDYIQTMEVNITEFVDFDSDLDEDSINDLSSPPSWDLVHSQGLQDTSDVPISRLSSRSSSEACLSDFSGSDQELLTPRDPGPEKEEVWSDLEVGSIAGDVFGDPSGPYHNLDPNCSLVQRPDDEREDWLMDDDGWEGLDSVTSIDRSYDLYEEDDFW
ncbi:hypothetical protein CC1G_07188 [Coprinopsis cinerea okayama7|uniref:Uncharacterized protein n=1 Tax=Coprinopsis cinerea (strain Okayama-7 / 130 / ATCC MYA-4618 / FGSC 9003) TaxID=240176 RepID=A8NRE1_COPC7|nr:hypothetical protein CC1G_07188 [Coprinopsis cinerea okayama7\|eukprot:XP_001835764.1 hypothetical protein CC1G_07188 [Coprinopsis cinerea okayama7\